MMGVAAPSHQPATLLVNSWVVADLDGTLSDDNHRQHFAEAKDWDNYNAAAERDEVFSDAAAVLKLLATRYSLMLATGRDEAFRPELYHWLTKHDLQIFDWVEMRPTGDRRESFDLKISMMKGLFGDLETAMRAVHFMLEDRTKVAVQLRAAGFNVWDLRGATI